MQKSVLDVQELCVQFSTPDGLLTAVDGVTFSVASGETLGIVGESGSGKSACALSLLRLIPRPPGRISKGSVILEGTDLLGLSDADIRRVRGNAMSISFQEPMTALNPVMPIGRQVAESLEIHKGMSRKQSIAKAVDLLSQVRIPNARMRINAYPHQLSGGMRQRVMIAMAIACNPRVLIADEPTTALDVTTQAQILELMKSLTRARGTALILITHNLGLIARYADRVHVMYAGRIVEKAHVAAIYRRPAHPYTAGLLASVPRLTQDIHRKLQPIEGQPPDLIHLPSGCAFYPRCRSRKSVCLKERPELYTIDENHEVACWNYVHD